MKQAFRNFDLVPTSTSEPLSSAQTVYVARHPIFDTGNRRVAYELLYRASAGALNSGSISGDAMCSDTALHAVVSIGLDRLTDGVLAFVNITRDHLVGELYKVFDPSTVVLELLESIDGEPAVVDACRRAVADGYTLALDDYDGRPSLDVLLPLVKIVKLDVLHLTRDELAPTVTRLRRLGLTVLAERVETGAMRTECQQLGCDLFQGYVFSRPETLDGRAISLAQTTMLNVMGLLGDSRVSDTALEEAFRSHPSLSLALLRIVNSASFGARSVESIPHAIRLVGREALSRWLLVMLVASVATQSPVANEVVMQAMIRARFCELLTERAGSGDPAARFMVGLLSFIDVLLAQPMPQILEQLPVTDDIRNALLRGTGPHAATLALAKAYDAGDWLTVDASYVDDATDRGLDPAAMYAEAAQWARDRIQSANRA
ncbi:MAG: HDOD domain-containing protein [Gemmatimonadaceae bacterium]|nr:HDOD domain-containing protein [Gemmatimonadaceae bacterium]